MRLIDAIRAGLRRMLECCVFGGSTKKKKGRPALLSVAQYCWPRNPVYCSGDNIAGLEARVRIASTTILWDLHPALLLVGQYYGPQVPLYHKSHNFMELVSRFIVNSPLFYPKVALSNPHVRA